MKSPTKKITQTYIIALSVIAALTIFTYFFVQQILSNQAADSHVINISGRQRMLSQKLTKEALFMYQADSLELYMAKKAKLQEVFSLWKSSHDALMNGDEPMGVPPSYNSDEIKNLFQQISPHFKAMVQATEEVLMQTYERQHRDPLTVISQHEPDFLQLMNKITFQYDREAQQKIVRLENIELTLMCITLFVLLLEAFLIFRPAIQKVGLYFNSLQEANTSLEEKNTLLSGAQEKMQDYISEIDSVNRDLKLKIIQLEAAEEEIRQNAEELLAVNDSLALAQTQMEKVLAEKKDTSVQLAESVKGLQSAQQYLVQKEKMSSLGVLTAGVAHEINNPINFVYAGSNALNSIVGDLFKLVHEYSQIHPEDAYEDIRENLENVEQLKEELFFNELEDDIKTLIQDINTGAERTQKIVKSLSLFSKSNKLDKLEPADLKENLEAVLTLLNSQISDDIMVIKEYEESLPLIHCYTSQINQVFISLVANACEAMDGKGTLLITLKANKERDNVFFAVKDSGQGISPENINQIFDSFYSTKDQGSGMGLGLSIVKNIIDKHQGEIAVESQLGEGTTFSIRLPIIQTAS